MIELKNVSKYYRGESTVSLGMRRVTLNFRLGEFIAITGESGAGKSTLLNVVSGLDGYEEGEMYFNGKPTSHYQVADWELYRAKNIGFIFQNYNIIDSYTVYQNVILALEIQGYKHEKRKRAIELIEKVGLGHRIHHKASKLSGGEKQRCVIARALAKNCPIIVADEPTGNLDSESGEMIMKLLHEISKDKLVIVVTHNYKEVEPYVTRKIVMHDGEVVQDKEFKKIETKDELTIDDEKSKNMGFKALLRFAVRNIFATPKKTVFLLTLFILVIGAIVAMFSAAVSSVNNINAQTSFNFMNGLSVNRMEVTKRNNEPMTDSDIEYLSNLVGANNVSKNGEYLFNKAINIGTNSGGYIQGYSDYAKYLTKNEVVVMEGNDFDFESANAVYVSNDINVTVGRSYEVFVNGSSDRYTVTIAGKVNTGSSTTVYFNDSFVNLRIESAKRQMDIEPLLVSFSYNFADGKSWPVWQESTFLYRASSLIPKGEIHINENYIAEVYNQTEQTFTFINSSQEKKISKSLKVVITNDIYSMGEIIGLNTEDINEISKGLNADYIDENGDLKYYQASIHLRNKQEGLNILNRYNKEIYRIYYPFNVSDFASEFVKFIAIIGFGIGIIFLCVALFFILALVTKNMMVSQKKDFAIYRSIGATEKSLSRLVIVQEALYGTIGFILTMMIFTVLYFTVKEFYAMLIAINFWHILLIYAVVLLFSIRLGFRFNKKIFQYSVIETLTSDGGDFL